MPDADALARLLAGLMPGCAIGWALADGSHHLLPGEEVVGAVASRRAEFAAGRAAARMALGRAVAIPMGPDRAPVWPTGIAGSITHAGGVALAIVADSPGLIGLDLEREAALAPDLWPQVCTRDELDWLAAQHSARQQHLATAIFSAKESVFKAQYPHSRSLFGFDRLNVVLEQDHFTARFTGATPPFATGQVVAGRIGRAQGFVLTVVAA